MRFVNLEEYNVLPGSSIVPGSIVILWDYDTPPEIIIYPSI